MSRAFVIAPVAALVAVFLGCSSDTALFVRIDSDLRVPEEINGLRVRIDLDTGVKTLLDRTYSLGTQDDIPATLTVIADNDREAAVTVVVTGLKGETVVAEAAVGAAFAKGQTVDVDVFLARGSADHRDGGGDDSGGADRPAVDSGTGHSDASDGGHDVAVADAGEDSGTQNDIGVDASDSGDVGVDAGDATWPDAGSDDSGLDAGSAEDAGDAGDGGGSDAGQSDIGGIGAACDDGGCGGGLTCLASVGAAGGYCTTDCTDGTCPEVNTACLSGVLPDASFCARTCGSGKDCEFRPGFECVNVSFFDGSLCFTPTDGGVPDAGSYPRIEITQTDPPGNKVGIGQTATLEATLYTAYGVKDDTAVFAWGTKETACISFADGSKGIGVGAILAPSCVVIASAKGLMGELSVSVEAVVSTYAGSGTRNSKDDPDPRLAEFEVLSAGDIDNAGNVFVVENEIRLRKVASGGGAVTTVWDKSTSVCTDGDEAVFTYNHIADIAFDRSSGDLYFSDAFCNSIRRLSAGQVTTVFGSTPGYAEGDLASAAMNRPTWLAKTGGGLYFYDSANFAIRFINLVQGKVSTVAGSGVQGIKDGPVADSQVYLVRGIDYSAAHGLLFSDYRGFVRSTDGTTLRTIAGDGSCDHVDGSGAESRFCDVDSFLVDVNGIVFASENMKHYVRRIMVGADPSSTAVSTLAGNGGNGAADGLGSVATLFHPHKLIAAPDGRSFYVLDTGNYKIRALTFAK